MFAYEREADRSLVLAAGLADEWIEGAGVQVNRMPTVHGSLSYSLRRTDSTTLRFSIAAGVDAKMVLRPPLASPLRSVRVNDRACDSFDEKSVTILHGPAEIICTTA